VQPGDVVAIQQERTAGGGTNPRVRPILIAGLPRSGTNWTLDALARAPGCVGVLEPDNEDFGPSAGYAKRVLGRYPCLAPGEESSAYVQLWEWALQGAHVSSRIRWATWFLGLGRTHRIHTTWLAANLARNPHAHHGGGTDDPITRVIAKSIHAQLSLEWLADVFDIDVLVLLRHPANILASWIDVNLKDSRNSTLETRPEIRTRYLDPWGVSPPGPDPIEQMSWRIGLLTAVLEDAISRHPEWHVRTHEGLCRDPTVEFNHLYDDLGLEWTKKTVDHLQWRNRPGEAFKVNRVAETVANSWQSRLDDEQLETLRRVLGWFPISSWSDHDFERTNGGNLPE
jgi:hypothetical protein